LGVASTIKIKRSSVAGKVPLTTDLTTGEIAINTKDKKLYSSNGTAVFEIGSQLNNLTVSGNTTVAGVKANNSLGTSGQVLKTNGTTSYWGTDTAAVGTTNQILYRNSSNTLTGSSGLQYDGVSIKVNGNLESVYSNGNEGGEIFLNKPATGTTITNGVTIDVYQDRLRIFENGGTNRGAYIDISAAATGVGSNLLAGGGTSSNGFSGILVGSNVVVADSTSDRLTFVAGSGMTIAANPTTDTITFSSSGGAASNGFSGILVGSNVISADSSTDRLTFVAGSKISLAANPTTDTITIAAQTNEYLQVANAVATYQTKAVERAALANTNARITLVNQNLTGTNTALRTLISDRLQVANAAATYETKTTADARLANTNAYIATRASWTALTGTNTALRTLINDRLQVANAAATYQTIATERAALANTNARITLVNTNLTGTNTALRTLISDRLQVANAVATYATKSNPTTSGLLDHTGRVAISTNLSVTGNTTITGLVANGSLGTAGRVLKTNGTSVYWGVDATGTGGGGGFSNGQSISVTNLVVTGNATVSGIIANGSLGTSGKVLKTNGTSVYWGNDNSLYVPRVFSNTSQSTLSWNSNNYEQYQLTAVAATTTINADSGSPSNGQKIMFRLKDNGTARTISWTTGTTNSFRAIGVTLPTTTVATKTTYIGCVYNSTDSRWDVIAVAQET